ncbi:hypothetical protein PVAP13_5KG093787 [Panicum virgatum]|uniref:Uncharacterized protein n=1 Tax=Panicum virgatum TaxID=38727 RepID=A0A8T0SF88_PANVG|nr:hypothetical protein PVAP13_5KG093787 [Panicum virgatum]
MTVALEFVRSTPMARQAYQAPHPRRGAPGDGGRRADGEVRGLRPGGALHPDRPAAAPAADVADLRVRRRQLPVPGRVRGAGRSWSPGRGTTRRTTWRSSSPPPASAATACGPSGGGGRSRAWAASRRPWCPRRASTAWATTRRWSSWCTGTATWMRRRGWCTGRETGSSAWSACWRSMSRCGSRASRTSCSSRSGSRGLGTVRSSQMAGR